MPITLHIDHDKRRIVGEATGTLAERDLFAYQEEVGEFSDYDEIFDGTAVDRLQDIGSASLKRLAGRAAATDVAKRAKLAIVATEDVHYGLGRMYGAFREYAPHASRELAIFHSRAEAERWLDALDA